MKALHIIFGIGICGLTVLTDVSIAAKPTTVSGTIKVTSAGRMGRAGIHLKTDNKTIQLSATTTALTGELERMNKMNVS